MRKAWRCPFHLKAVKTVDAPECRSSALPLFRCYLGTNGITIPKRSSARSRWHFLGVTSYTAGHNTLAPYLFIIVIDYVMRTSTKNQASLGLTITQRLSQRFPATYITDTDFADDIALLSDSIEDAQCLLSLLIKTAKVVGLSINEDQTEYMSYNTPNPRNDTILANEKPLKKNERFQIFGLFGGQFRKRHEDEKSTSLGSNTET